MSRKPNPASLIKVVQPGAPATPTGGVIGFIKALNPLGPISDMFGRYIAYRTEVRRLEVERDRSHEEAQVWHLQIDAHLKVALQLLDERREALQNAMRLAAAELANHQVERRQVSEAVASLSEAIASADSDKETRQLCRETIGDLAKLLVTMGEQGAVRLSCIVETFNRSLEAAPEVRGLLPRQPPEE